LDANRAQALLHLVELERFDDRFDLFHVLSSREFAGSIPPIQKL
jgi:hypothetical protein